MEVDELGRVGWNSEMRPGCWIGPKRRVSMHTSMYWILRPFLCLIHLQSLTQTSTSLYHWYRSKLILLCLLTLTQTRRQVIPYSKEISSSQKSPMGFRVAYTCHAGILVRLGSFLLNAAILVKHGFHLYWLCCVTYIIFLFKVQNTSLHCVAFPLIITCHVHNEHLWQSRKFNLSFHV